MQNLLIVGGGDVARRALPWLLGKFRVCVLLRDPARHAEWRAAGALPVAGDLDRPASLRRLAGLAHRILHLAPPPGSGERDTRTRNLLAALGRAQSLPRSVTYVSTTGVYGDWGGARGDETRPPHPQSPRARRRVDAEQTLRAWGARRGVPVSILRAPGIYAAERLPLVRLRAGTPALCADDDVYSNHIHADDLAHACVRALWRGLPNRCYNAVDDGELKMADYFDLVAVRCGLPPPPRLPRHELAAQLSALQMSFMCESRRIDNRRLKCELGLRLKYPNVSVALADLTPLARNSACIS